MALKWMEADELADKKSKKRRTVSAPAKAEGMGYSSKEERGGEGVCML